MAVADRKRQVPTLQLTADDHLAFRKTDCRNRLHVGSSESWGPSSTHIHGTHVPVGGAVHSIRTERAALEGTIRQFDITQKRLGAADILSIVHDREVVRLGNWFPITTVPFDRDVQLSVIERGDVYALVFPCRRTDSGWVDAATLKPVFVDPTHWREWPDRESS